MPQGDKSTELWCGQMAAKYNFMMDNCLCLALPGDKFEFCESGNDPDPAAST